MLGDEEIQMRQFETEPSAGTLSGIAREPARRREDNDPDGMKFRLKAAAVLLGIYTAMHLAVGGVVHLLNAPGAIAAGTPAQPTAASAEVTAQSFPADADESPAIESRVRAAQPADYR